MKYTDIAIVNSECVSMRLGCSNCGKCAESGDSFCRHCGHKLEKRQGIINKKKLVEIINRHTDELNEDISFAEESVEESKTDIEKDRHSGYCMRGLSGCEGCQFLTTDGYCTFLVYTSYPPQYQKCPFSKVAGSQFKKCSDVGLSSYRKTSTSSNSNTVATLKKEPFVEYAEKTNETTAKG